MTDIFVSFATADTLRVQPIVDGFRQLGMSVFWSNDIPKGAVDYHAVIKQKINESAIVIVAWTKASVTSNPVIQECAQAELPNILDSAKQRTVAPGVASMHP
jgi:hypothetical protein